MTQSIPLGSDARERFLLEIAAVVPPTRVSEVHFFAPMRQGPIETGVAVIAATPEGAEAAGSAAGADSQPEARGADAGSDASASESAAEESAIADAAAAQEPEFAEGAKISSRHVVYSARYRWTRKGPERGRWESEVVAEADAPLLTVETVVQGVTRRSAEPLEVEKLDGDTVREMIAKAQQRWPTTP